MDDCVTNQLKQGSSKFEYIRVVTTHITLQKTITIVLAVRNNGKMQLTPYTTETRIIYIYIYIMFPIRRSCPRN